MRKDEKMPNLIDEIRDASDGDAIQRFGLNLRRHFAH